MTINWVTNKPSFSFIPKVRKRASEKALEIAKAVWQGAVDRTPVRSGELRASWNLSKGSPDFSTVGLASGASRNSGVPLPSPTMPNLKASALSSARYFVSNGKEYVIPVEFGSTTVIPHLMLTNAIRSVDL